MSTTINPLSKALELEEEKRQKNNEEFRKQQLRDSYRERGASNAQIECWEGLSNTERSEIKPWQVLSTANQEKNFFLKKGASNAQIKYWQSLNISDRKPLLPWKVVLPTPPSSPPPKPKLKPTPPPYPKEKPPQVTYEDPNNPTLGGGKKTRRKRSNLKQKSRMANKKNKSKRNRRK